MRPLCKVAIMPCNSDQERCVDQFAERLRLAQTATPELVSELIAALCTRIQMINRTSNVAVRFERLINSAAWTDVALALIEIELPRWKLRRLVLDDGEWHCSLSKTPDLAIEIDETADGNHGVLALAVLQAFLQARRMNSAFCRSGSPAVPRVWPAPAYIVCCDNFA